ncbi:MAG TPA: AraC family transcriptional regulator [Planctomycetota bacterium]|nr:AraC family transcriptional regulator [Planctomycetota bacterium]
MPDTSFPGITHAVAALNAMPSVAVSFGALRVRYLHWGVTPPDYWRSARHPNPCERHKHPYYEVCHAFEGRGAFETFSPHTQREISAGDTFFARPGLEHRYGSARPDELGICFWSFALEGAGKRRGGVGEAGRVLLNFNASRETLISADEITRQTLELIFSAALIAQRPDSLTPLLQFLAQHLAAAVAGTPSVSDVPEPDAQSGGAVLWKAQQFIQDHCHRDLRIEELAERTGYSRRHLARMFQSHAGLSFSEYLARVRMQTACHLLLDESQPLKQVARKTGFASLAAFTRAFKRGMGVTPGEYRARSLGAGR